MRRGAVADFTFYGLPLLGKGNQCDKRARRVPPEYSARSDSESSDEQVTQDQHND